MSLFDVIRYPIGYPPTIEQLAALPKELYMKWIKASEWARFTEPNEDGDIEFDSYAIENVAGWYRDYIHTRHYGEKDELDLKRLHGIIAEWEEK